MTADLFASSLSSGNPKSFEKTTNFAPITQRRGLLNVIMGVNSFGHKNTRAPSQNHQISRIYPTIAKMKTNRHPHKTPVKLAAIQN